MAGENLRFLGFELCIEDTSTALSIHEEGIMDIPKKCALPFYRPHLLPYDLISEVVAPKYFIQHYLHVVSNMPVHVYIKASILVKQFMKKYDCFIEPLEIRV